MNKTIKYTDEKIGDIKIIEDFLPSPQENITFFKSEAKKYHTQYQKMIRSLLDVYTSKHICNKREPIGNL